MVFKGEGHVLLDGERIVKRCLLKQESHLLSDFAHAVQRETCDVLAMNANRSGVRRFESNDEPQQHAFPGAAASEYGQGFPLIHAQADSVENLVAPEGLVYVFDSNDGRKTVSGGFGLLRRNVISRGHFYFTHVSNKS